VVALVIFCGLAVARNFPTCAFSIEVPPTISYFIAFPPVGGVIVSCDAQPNNYSGSVLGPEYAYGLAICKSQPNYATGCFATCCNSPSGPYFQAYAQCSCACGGSQCENIGPFACLGDCTDNCVMNSNVSPPSTAPSEATIATGYDVVGCSVTQPPSLSLSAAPTSSGGASLVTSRGLTWITVVLAFVNYVF
jgi:hypothetical protein